MLLTNQNAEIVACILLGAELEAWRHKMFRIFYFLRCEMVLGIVNPL